MPTTSNFGWTTPADTDLVKDGALAIRTLGNGIDTSFLDLKGGTTGQILSKASNTDLDYTWINNDQGDITAVTAGTGISGGGTSGAVTITNSMATEITASGDIIVGTGSGTFDNLPIGTTGQVLTADTTVSPYKVKWAALPSSTPTYSGALVYKDSNTSIPNNSETFLTYNTEAFDTDGYHSTTSNTGRLTAPTGKSGYYQVWALSRWAADSNGVRTMQITKNAAQTSIGTVEQTPGGVNCNNGHSLSTVVYLAAGDYVECKVYQTSGGAINCLGDISQMHFGITFLGA